jgi:hypothetical protein
MITDEEFELAKSDRPLFYFVKFMQITLGCLIGYALAYLISKVI